MPRKDRRLVLPALGEYYDDLLKYDSEMDNATKAQKARSLLGAKLQEREPLILRRLEYLARKRGISVEELQLLMLSGKYKPLTIEEALPDEEEFEDEVG
jgi:hypothetical protein